MEINHRKDGKKNKEIKLEPEKTKKVQLNFMVEVCLRY